MSVLFMKDFIDEHQDSHASPETCILCSTDLEFMDKFDATHRLVNHPFLISTPLTLIVLYLSIHLSIHPSHFIPLFWSYFSYHLQLIIFPFSVTGTWRFTSQHLPPWRITSTFKDGPGTSWTCRPWPLTMATHRKLLQNPTASKKSFWKKRPCEKYEKETRNESRVQTLIHLFIFSCMHATLQSVISMSVNLSLRPSICTIFSLLTFTDSFQTRHQISIRRSVRPSVTYLGLFTLLLLPKYLISPCISDWFNQLYVQLSLSPINFVHKFYPICFYFFVADTQLYKSRSPSVRPSIRVITSPPPLPTPSPPPPPTHTSATGINRVSGLVFFFVLNLPVGKTITITKRISIYLYGKQ